MSRPDDTRWFDETGHLWPYDIVFDPAHRRHLWQDGDRAHFRLATEPGFDEAILVRNRDGDVDGHQMRRWAQETRYDHWQVEVEGSESFDYSVALRHSSGEVVYLTNAGVAGAIERLDRWTYEPGAAVLDVPDWMHGTVIYQIYPERFANGDPSLTPEPSAPWGSPPDNYLWQGGDLIGVRQRLDHLHELGVGCLYLNPIFHGPSTHNYDAFDFRNVDPSFGGNEALADLVAAAHERGIRVILDTSFNHVHPQFFAFADIVANGPDSAYADWFVVHEHPVRVRYRPHIEVPQRYRWYLDRIERLTGLPVELMDDDDGPPAEPTYDAWYGVPTMPRVNLHNPEARRYFLDTARFWIEEFDIDGYRMDVTRYVDPDFWDDFRAACRDAKADAYLICEIFGDATPWVDGGRFDATMNYTFRQLAIDFFAQRTADARSLADGIIRMLAMYPSPVTAVNQNLLGSHDVARFLTEAGDDDRSLLLATVFQFTMPGAPGLYYGDEVGMSGGEDPNQRGGFPWDEPESWHSDQLKAVQELSALRLTHPALRRGAWRLIAAEGRMIMFERSIDDESVVTVINDAEQPVSVDVDAEFILWGEAEVDSGEIVVPPRSAAILA